MPDILRPQAQSAEHAELSTFEDSAFWQHQPKQQQEERHVIVNQLLTFLTEKQLAEEQQRQNSQLIGYFNEATSGTASTSATLRLTK